ncbi:MAG: hypothetical protein H0W61_05975 [Bacteroidetes bacterium]|nr:hypothetical protein [Bacteroidota bacterium]
MRKLVIAALIVTVIVSCKKKTTAEPEPEPTPTPVVNNCPTCTFPDTVFTQSGTGPKLIFKFKFDSTQVRLNSFGMPSTVPSTNAAQSPIFNGMSAHYIELAPNDLTPVGGGKVLYKAEETMCGGSKAITFCKSVVSKEGDVCFAIPISSITPGSYKWLRVSLAYQNYDIKVRANNQNITGTIGSFVGFNTYVTQYKMKGAVMTPTAGGGAGNHAQGYWGFLTTVSGFTYKSDGQAAQTTVVNPNFANSPIPAGSCLVTGAFEQFANPGTGAPLVITGTETNDIVITISLSTNKSFEWKEITFDGLFEPSAGEYVVDMGLRGLIPKY